MHTCAYKCPTQAWVLCAAIFAALCTAVGPILTMNRASPSPEATQSTSPGATLYHDDETPEEERAAAL
eukprot:scaffold96873_cov19-Tisochrysis_lutea.AAC.1